MLQIVKILGVYLVMANLTYSYGQDSIEFRLAIVSEYGPSQLKNILKDTTLTDKHLCLVEHRRIRHKIHFYHSKSFKDFNLFFNLYQVLLDDTEYSLHIKMQFCVQDTCFDFQPHGAGEIIDQYSKEYHLNKIRGDFNGDGDYDYMQIEPFIGMLDDGYQVNFYNKSNSVHSLIDSVYRPVLLFSEGDLDYDGCDELSIISWTGQLNSKMKWSIYSYKNNEWVKFLIWEPFTVDFSKLTDLRDIVSLVHAEKPYVQITLKESSRIRAEFGYVIGKIFRFTIPYGTNL